MIILDASCVIDFALRMRSAPELSNLMKQNDVFAAPHLLTYEVVNILRRQVIAKLCSEERAQQGLVLFRELNFEFYDAEIMLDRVWQLRHNFTAYDASYIALAEMLDAPFYTRDHRLANASGHRAQVIKI